MSVPRSSTRVLRSVPAQLRTAGASRSLSTSRAAAIPYVALHETAPVVSLTVAARAGPRYEPAEGVAHALKNFAFRSTNERSALRIVREAELNGGALSAALNKEHLLLTAEFLKGDEEHFAALLAEVVRSTKYNQFEFKEDVLPSLAEDLAQASQDPVVYGLEALQATAYRYQGVGSTLFANPAVPVQLADVKAFAGQAFTQANLALVSSGLSGAQVEQLAKHFDGVPAGEALLPPPAKYYGGDFRAPIADAHGHPLPQDHFFLAFESGAQTNRAEVAVLEALLGGTSSVKWSHGQTPLARIQQQVEGAEVRAFNTVSQGTGLFGLHVAAPQGKVADAAKLAVQALQRIASGAPSAEELARAVANAKFGAAMRFEGTRQLAHESVAAALLNDGTPSLSERLAKIDAVDAAAVSSLAESLLKSKPTTTALGALKQLPYAEELL
ncbi:ubiquinol-cytochrome c reductase core subunit 1 [Malassezia brasiliensis]|uniref:Cytochrome b-c1 complex subunit 2, mitochondrial n=1 Tax=Malassezia brasiliensis TaxID=1821822 RepID=A0AAF0IN49_9BASI|nr:ubiquinol-cytochrome c reductase core subunit 1 [Malassezia brasiliensis]